MSDFKFQEDALMAYAHGEEVQGCPVQLKTNWPGQDTPQYKPIKQQILIDDANGITLTEYDTHEQAMDYMRRVGRRQGHCIRIYEPDEVEHMANLSEQREVKRQQFMGG